MHTHRPSARLSALLAAVIVTAIAAIPLACARTEAPAATGSSGTGSAATSSPTSAGAAATATATVEPARATATTGTPAATPATPATVGPSATATPAPAATAAAGVVASTAATPRTALPIAEFSNADGFAIRLPVEVPPPTEYSIGLSGRRAMDERGMLFYFPQTARGPFWMKDTHIDLSIAFVTTDERIVDIREMRAESTDLVTPSADYRYAIEAPAGWYAKHKVRVGDTARLNFPLPKTITGG